MTKEQLKGLTITRTLILSEYGKLVKYFVERENFKIQLRTTIEKYGIDKLGPEARKSCPKDLRVLYERSWKWNIIVRVRMIQSAMLNARNTLNRRVADA